MKLYKSDLGKIGHTAYSPDEYDNFLVVVCDGRTANIEEILLRNILLLWGDYEITDTFESEGVNEECCDVEFVTNLPWKEYQDYFTCK